MNLREKLTTKVKVLHETVWESKRASGPEVLEWLANFNGDQEEVHALWLLSQFMYFGDHETRELLRALFRDLVKYPIVASIRRANADTTDQKFLAREFNKELEQIRFLGMGNPSESGGHLLYYLRQENSLPIELFIQTRDIFRRFGQPSEVHLRAPGVRRYVYIDDFCGSGDQATEYSQGVLSDIKGIDASVELHYYPLLATRQGLDNVRHNTVFDHVDAVSVLDESYKCFVPESRYFSEQPQEQEIEKQFAEEMCRGHGATLCALHPLGYNDGQLLLGFHHNTPDNTLPIFWCSKDGGPNWQPIFHRYPKL
jgi:hypothetical protein